MIHHVPPNAGAWSSYCGHTRKIRNHFPDVIITGRGAAVYSWRNKFAGATMVLNFSTIGDDAMPWHPLNDHSFEALMILMKY
ncbi:hypothetical protein [Prevotella sp. AGR2160]|uniref:hypothetical protein n=1 Tax=Prevotella sp. AGR2160 TaxID=1280674 RepID=UPI0004062851|nr:hypothetical protein [Prevotella sp. AGR2160]